VHGADVRRVLVAPREDDSPRAADGQATALSGVAPMVLVADCLPIALAGGGAVAMLHAGWRGLAAGVIAEGAQAVRELGGREPLVAAIGPGAGVCCYEVGEEVHAAFAGRADGFRRDRNLDLKAIARSDLRAAGVEVVHDAGLCTICAERTLFYSHRRDRGVTGRQAGIAWLT
jgi:YfiH family protein